VSEEVGEREVCGTAEIDVRWEGGGEVGQCVDYPGHEVEDPIYGAGKGANDLFYLISILLK